MPDIHQEYERLHLKAIVAINKRIRKVYEKAINDITVDIRAIKLKDKLFNLADYPQLKKRVDAVTKQVHAAVYTISVNSIEDSWGLANKKNNVILDKRLAGKKVPKSVKQVLYDPNADGLSQFIKRKERGLNLSERIWKSLQPFKAEAEQTLGLSIAKGQSAIETAKQMQQYLNEPDKLFRRVRNEEGKLVLSQTARNYHPGQGVYRSSYKNALRLTRTENNLAYRYSDHERWQTMPFVTGFEVKLSKSHPRYDICDNLVGKYPKDFKFGGWHPQCLCYQVPIMNTDDDFEKMEDAILAGESIPEAEGQIYDTPAGFKKWLKDNGDRVDGWKSKPYWMRDNNGYVDDARFVGLPFDTKDQVKVNINQALKQGKDSFEFYRAPNGDFTPARKQLHEDIIEEILSQGSTDTGFVYSLGGAPANGKSTLIESGLLDHPKGVLKVDPDHVKSKLPEYKELVESKNPIAAAFAHEESSYISKQISQRALEKNFDLLNDGVGDGKFEELAKKIKRYNDAGKKVRADYVTLDTDLSLELAEVRAKKSGREPPKQFILDMNREIANLVPQLIKANTFDELYLWDTNLNSKPRLILSQVNGKLKVADWKLYNQFLKKRNYGK